ncbi:uncharacterized protein MONBRDRAFT_33244 [Monosiga brevicollis MX1]|uniref:Aldehyde dehydrogenase domain-containing protein n=1 Tax=Monosiga brevicollis TaxID=81824 RepID=A9V4C4_MONBE|nr:uncharacterized protein MONBRDRAFT_33244 [Monosiga brevicollis MX1]EDQ87590.1 predicted protein [Monosiga brevicollis MX1]|eukprot:XP_001747510.1 hypothetical protein [Monosiga brevicollis MX1]
MAAFVQAQAESAVAQANSWLAAAGVDASIPAPPEQFGLYAGAVVAGYGLYRAGNALFSGRDELLIPLPVEASEDWKPTQFLKDAAPQDPLNANVIRTYDKFTHAVLGSGAVPVCSPADVREAVAKARVAQRQWAQTNFEERREVLRYMQDYITAHQREICVIASRDTGKTLVDGAFGEVLVTCEKISWTLQHGEQALRTEYRKTGMIMSHKTARVEYIPLGVMGAIIPWNYPFHNLFGQIISAIFAGNAIVVKASEYATWSSLAYLRIVHTILDHFGIDRNLVQIVTGFGPTGAALVESGVDKLVFIGSPGVGKLVMKAASNNLTPVVLELGGKDAAIICEDCDFDQAVNLALRGTFQNCGQNCIGLERLIVHEGVYDKMVATLAPKVQALVQGCPADGDVDCGAMTMGVASAQKIEELVQRAVAQGARCLAGGMMHQGQQGVAGYMTPTLLVDVTPDMDIAQHEVFGPVMTVMKARDDADAVRIANSVEYGLGSSVFSRNYARAERIANQLTTGMCNINDFGVNYLCQALPFGGVNISGFDRFAGVEGLRGCCLMRSITSDRFPGVRTNIPPPLQYPVKAAGFAFCESLVNLFYADSLWTKVKAAFNLATL